MYRVLVVKGYPNSRTSSDEKTHVNADELEKVLNEGWEIHYSQAMRETCLVV